MPDYQYKPVPNEARTFPHNALWSAPRSGNYWVRFIVEYLTGHPTAGYRDNPGDKPIFTNKFPSIFHPLSHVRSDLPYILYKGHEAYPLPDNSTIILLVRDINEHIARDVDNKTYVEKLMRSYINLIKAYDEFSGTKIFIYYEDLLLNPEREILRIQHFLGASDSRYKAFMKNYEKLVYTSKHPEARPWSGSCSGLNFNFWRELPLKRNNSFKEHIGFFHKLLTNPEYQRVKPYIARYSKLGQWSPRLFKFTT